MCKDCPHPCALFPASPNRQEKGRERLPKPGIIIATSQPRRARARGTEKKPRRRHKGEPRVCPRREQGWTRRSRSRRGARDEEKGRKREKGGGDGKGIQNKENERKAEQEEEREMRTCGRDRKSKRGALARRRGRGGRGHPEGARGDADDRGALRPRGSRRGGGGPSSRRLSPPRRSEQPHSSGFPTHSPSKSPQSPDFSRAPPPPGPEKLFFTPSWSLICCGGKKAAFVGRGAARGGGAGDPAIVCPRSCAPRAARVGPPGRGRGRPPRGRAGPGWGAGARVRMAGAGRPGPGWGPRGRGVRAGGSQGPREWRKRATRARKPIVLLALFCSWPRDWGKMGTRGKGTWGEGCTPAGGRILRQGATRTLETHRTFK